MKKYFIHFLLALMVISAVFSFSVGVQTASAITAQTMTISQFVELMITIGVVPTERVVAVRAAISTLSQAVSVAPFSSVTSLSNPAVSTSTAYIQVLSPNGGERWEVGVDVAYSVKWGSAGLPGVNITLVSSNNSLCGLNQSPVASKDGVNTFNILLKSAKCYSTGTTTTTLLKSGSYKVRVYYTDYLGHSVKDESNAAFIIAPELLPSIKVTYPNGSESLIRNNNYVVKYTLKNATIRENLIYLDLLDNLGNSVYNGHKVVTTGGTYNLDLPSSLTPGAYKIKLSATTNSRVEIEDTSDNFFWISSPNI